MSGSAPSRVKEACRVSGSAPGRMKETCRVSGGAPGTMKETCRMSGDAPGRMKEACRMSGGAPDRMDEVRRMSGEAVSREKLACRTAFHRRWAGPIGFFLEVTGADGLSAGAVRSEFEERRELALSSTGMASMGGSTPGPSAKVCARSATL